MIQNQLLIYDTYAMKGSTLTLWLSVMIFTVHAELEKLIRQQTRHILVSFDSHN